MILAHRCLLHLLAIRCGGVELSTTSALTSPMHFASQLMPCSALPRSKPNRLRISEAISCAASSLDRGVVVSDVSLMALHPTMLDLYSIATGIRLLPTRLFLRDVTLVAQLRRPLSSPQSGCSYPRQDRFVRERVDQPLQDWASVAASSPAHSNSSCHTRNIVS